LLKIELADNIIVMIDVVFDCNLCELEATDKYGAIKELTSKTESLKSLSSLEQFQDSVIKREEEMSTGLGEGVAIAHGNCEESKKLIVALGISHKGIEYNSIDNKPVHILFLVANPPDSQNEYLHLLSSIVRLLRQENFRQKILNTYDPVLLNSHLKKYMTLVN